MTAFALQVALFACSVPVARAQPAGEKPAAEKGAGEKPATEPNTPATAAADADTPEIQDIRNRIDKQLATTDALVKKVWTLKGKSSLSNDRAAGIEVQLNAATKLLKSFQARLDTTRARPRATQADQAAVKQETEGLKAEVGAVETSLGGISQELTDLEKASGWNLIDILLEARCSTAICFANGSKKNWLGIEPLVELPFGKSFAIGSTHLSDWVNNHDLRVDLAAGARVWLFRDVFSISLYLSKPLNDTPVRLTGDPFVYPGASIRRPYPGAAIGLFFDSLWIGVDRDELRNGDGQSATTSDVPSGAVNTKYPPNSVISSTWTVTIALQPVTAFRTAIGTAVKAKGR